MSGKTEVVFIRKSSAGQNEEPQIQNVRNMLRDAGIMVSDKNWFSGTVSRRKLKGNDEFNRLMALVEADQVRTVYVESQDRFGSKDRKELFTLLGILSQHKCRLIDLRTKTDLTKSDFTTEILAMMASFKSEKELQDLSYRSLRTRVGRLKDVGSWPGGAMPYGFDKAAYSPDGKLLWVWHPTTSRHMGQQFFVREGELIPGAECKQPRKSKLEVMKLRPSVDAQAQDTIRDVFRWYTTESISRRQLAIRLNKAGRSVYGAHFTHDTVLSILVNQAYIGNTVFGKSKTGELTQFDAAGLLSPVQDYDGPTRREVADCIVKEGTHEGLVDEKVFEGPHD